MKIEKISDTQIKFILNQADLSERNVELEELISPSEKIQELFRDIMEQAMDECGFCAENSPIMVEAVPVALDGIMIIVTKMESERTNGNKITMLTPGKDVQRFKKKTISRGDVDDPGLIGDVGVFVFNRLDEVIDSSVRLQDRFHGGSSLFKLEGRYYLVIQNDVPSDKLTMKDIELLLEEYGKVFSNSSLTKYYLMEHGETVIKRCAVKALAESFS